MSNRNQLINSISFNQLAYFSGSNLLCGLLNLQNKTLYVSFWRAIYLHAIYLFIPGIIYGTFEQMNVKVF